MLLLDAARLLSHVWILYTSYKVLEEKRSKGDARTRRRRLRRDLSTCCCWAIITTMEPTMDFLIAWAIPLYDQLKLLFLIVFLSSRSLLCEEIFRNLSAVLFQPYTKQIDFCLDVVDILITLFLSLLSRTLLPVYKALRIPYDRLSSLLRPFRSVSSPTAPSSPPSDVHIAELLSPVRRRRAEYHGAQHVPGSLIATPYPARSSRRSAVEQTTERNIDSTPDVERAAVVFASMELHVPPPPPPAPTKEEPEAIKSALPSKAGPSRSTVKETRVATTKRKPLTRPAALATSRKGKEVEEAPTVRPTRLPRTAPTARPTRRKAEEEAPMESRLSPRKRRRVEAKEAAPAPAVKRKPGRAVQRAV